MSFRTSRSPLLAAVAALLLGLPAGATAQERVELSATTELSGASNGYVPVRLNHEARVSDRFTEVASVGRIQSDSRVAGAILRAEPVGPPAENPEEEAVPETMVFWRGVPEAGEHVFGSRPAPSGGEVLLSPGDYRLYLVTDGAETTVTLNLRGLDEGTRRLHPTFATPATLADPPLLTGGPPTWTFGSDRQATSEGWVMAQLRTQTPGSGPTHREICIREGDEPASYDSGCSNGGSGQSDDSVEVQPGEQLMTYTRWVFRPGRYMVGGNVTFLQPGPAAAAPEMRAALVSFEPSTPIARAPASAEPPSPTPAATVPLPAVVRRSGRRVRGGISVKLRCRAATACSGYVRLGAARSRRVTVPEGRSIRVSLRGLVRRGRAWVTVEALIGARRARVRVKVRRAG